ncbi:MAG: toll/interleukin-1 receptor domain-containing protein [Xanthobacteraceae bacterium]
MAGKIFINYRREDSIAVAGRLQDRLAAMFGRDNLFMDVDNIPIGINFEEYLNNQVAQCDAMLSVIGPNWLDAKDDTNQRRLDKPDDFVAIEIAAALARNILVIPVLVDGTHMPKASELPASLKPFAFRNAIQLRNTNFGSDAEVLIAKMREALGLEGAETTQGRFNLISGEVISDVDRAFVQATDNLISLYRKIEKRIPDLPIFTITPFLIFWWASLKFTFFLLIGILLIIPTNLIILIRNLFPGEHWNYRPFFLKHVYYAWLWVWHGEAPIAPQIFIRPLLNIFLKEHFARRLRRLREEIALHDGLADATRSTLTGRLDSALERWSPPRYATLFFTFAVPVILYLPALSEKLIHFVESLGFRPPTEYAVTLLSQAAPGALIVLGGTAIWYLIAVPFTAYLAKRGLFLGADRIWFPGWHDGSGAYQKEREIFSSVDIRVREAPLDLWIFGILTLVGYGFALLTRDLTNAWVQSWAGPAPQAGLLNIETIVIQIVQIVILLAGFVIAGVRRARLGRA